MSSATKTRVAVLVSGGGSNLQSLIEATDTPDFPAEIALVISNKAEAYGLVRAKNSLIKTIVLDHSLYTSRETFDKEIHAVLVENQIQLVCLAGYMRILSPAFVAKWPNRIINIHPSLLPSFPGLNVHQRAIDAGVKFSGCTVHLVGAGLDDGPIIIQAAVPVLANDTAKNLASRILESEHRIYPKALEWIASGRARLIKGQVVVNEEDEGRASASIWPL